MDASIVSCRPLWKLSNQSNKNDPSNWRHFQETSPPNKRRNEMEEYQRVDLPLTWKHSTVSGRFDLMYTCETLPKIPMWTLELSQQAQEPRTLSYSAGSVWRSTLLLDMTVNIERFWISSSVSVLFRILPRYNFCTWQLLQYGYVWGLRHLVKFRMRLR